MNYKILKHNDGRKGFSSTVGYCPNCKKPLINGNLLYENWMIEMASNEDNKTTFDEWLVNTNKKHEPEPKEESQDELWAEVIKEYLIMAQRGDDHAIAHLKSKFRISRVKTERVKK